MKNKKVLVTGSQGFIGSFVCSELLENGYQVLGIDDYSKYGYIKRNHDDHPNFEFKTSDLSKDNFVLGDSLNEFDPSILINLAAKIGGISYFHQFAYDLIAANERITSNTFDASICSHMRKGLERIIVLSSSMVYESATRFPVKEEDVDIFPPPRSSYGFQKLATEYFAKAAFDQYGLPYTIIRPFNCVGVGEDKSISCSDTTSGNIKLTLSHVLPDLIHKLLNGQNPLHILGDGKQIRCYTHGKDIARGIRLAMESDKAVNEAFNISIGTQTTVLELAELVWSKIRKDKFEFVSDPPFKHDVRERIPDVSKAENVLGFKAEISLEQSVDEVIAYLSSNAPSFLQMAS
jgi:nucleoside-diphosphate-sugar epimerase